MNQAVQAGDQVYWWRQLNSGGEYPYRAEVIKVGAARVTIAVEPLEGGSERIRRCVPARSLQVLGGYFAMAEDQDPRMLQPAASWGRFARYLEVGEDLRAIRHVDVFGNGNMLCYDRSHWIDDFGQLADARLNRNRNTERYSGRSEEIDATTFERIWDAARESPLCTAQQACARMNERGAVPVWLAIGGWRPTDLLSSGAA